MNPPYKNLISALSQMLDKIDDVLNSNGYKGNSIQMFLAGGMAVNYYCGTRHTEDVDASFSKRLLLPYEDLSVSYIDEQGKPSFIYFDQNYNTSFALMHEDFEDDSKEWVGIGNENRKIQLRVLSPIDLAVSKIARFGEQDCEDILRLAADGYFSADELRSRAEEALSYYVGNTRSVQNGINIICQRIEQQRFPSDKPA